MSSTNRSNARDSHISDFYKTSVNDICTFLDRFIRDYNTGFNFVKYRYKILDPCAGGKVGSELMSYPEALKRIGFGYEKLQTLDIREDSCANIKTDYLKWIPDDKYNVIITNPPFNIALDVIKKSLEIVYEHGLVIMLLRLNFFGSQERKKFFDQQMPIACYVHSKRMKFTDKGTDSVEYMHCVWQKGNYPKFTKLRII